MRATFARIATSCARQPWIVLAIGLALVTGPLGCFVVWRRMAFFGDTLAHSELVGIALGLLLELGVQVTVVGAACLLAVALWMLEKQQRLATDTLLGILAHSSLATKRVRERMASSLQRSACASNQRARSR